MPSTGTARAGLKERSQVSDRNPAIVRRLSLVLLETIPMSRLRPDTARTPAAVRTPVREPVAVNPAGQLSSWVRLPSSPPPHTPSLFLAVFTAGSCRGEILCELPHPGGRLQVERHVPTNEQGIEIEPGHAQDRLPPAHRAHDEPGPYRMAPAAARQPA